MQNLMGYEDIYHNLRVPVITPYDCTLQDNKSFKTDSLVASLLY